MLADGFHDVPAGKIAMVVTHLEMTRKAQTRAATLADGVTLRAVPDPSADWYRDVYGRVGMEWLWFSRLTLEDHALNAILRDPHVEIYTLRYNGRDEALLELDFREDGACELAFFGLTSNMIGTGAGRALMNVAIDRAWAREISRFHVHTCTIDSPQALNFYIRSGFTPVRRQIEIADDPRLTDGFDRSLAAHVPIIEVR